MTGLLADWEGMTGTVVKAYEHTIHCPFQHPSDFDWFVAVDEDPYHVLGIGLLPMYEYEMEAI